MILTDDTLQLVKFEASPAPEDSDATITLTWLVNNADQVTIEGPGVGRAGLDRYTAYSGNGEIHVKTSESNPSYKLTVAPDPQRLIQGHCEINIVDGVAQAKPEVFAKKGGDPEALAEDETGITNLGFKGITVKKGIGYVEHNSKQTLEWAYQNGDEASFSVLKGEVPGLPEGSVKAEGTAAVGPFSELAGAVVELKISSPKSVTKKLDIRIKRAQIAVTHDSVAAGEQATLSWNVEHATAIEITPFHGTQVAAPTNPDFSGSLTFEVEAGQTYEFKVDATSADGRRSHKIMTATVA